jgi:TfoX/Sxy family transcriptional regulator of competence genes
MAYDERLAQRIRKFLSGRKGFTERKMFGGICFLLDGRMCCGVIHDDLCVRVGAKGYEEALSQAYTRPMDFTGRPLKGLVYVAPTGIQTHASLKKWLQWAADFATTDAKKVVRRKTAVQQ